MSLSFAGAAASPVTNAGKLLIVDDLADNRAVLTRRFLRRGFEVVEAESGEEALRLIREHAFDTVLLDVMMPGMDGNETLAQIRRDYPATALPVIMVTAKSQSEDMVASLQLGANDYVTKPVDFNVALARVVKQIGVRRADLELRRNNEALEADKTQLEHRFSEHGAMLVKANEVIEEEVARRIASEDRIAYLARHDVLTGLPNRFGFDERFQESCRTAGGSGSQLGLLFVDLDGFKNVNDTLGHAVGDELLRDVAAKISCVVGPRDSCARFGGDEFAIVHLSEDVQTTAATLAQDVIAAGEPGDHPRRDRPQREHGHLHDG
jgi:PleD family two-component response regulator